MQRKIHARLEFILILSMILLVSCVKEPIRFLNPRVDDGVGGLPVPQDFNWAMTQNVPIRVSGLKTLVPIRNTMVISDEEGNLILKRQNQMGENYDILVSVPSTTKRLVITFGSISKSFDITGDTIGFDYLIPIPEAADTETAE
jgi:hypothetical protein